MTERELLTAGRERIADQHHHCKGMMAQDAEGEEVDARSPKAAAWCAYGTLLASAAPELLHPSENCLKAGPGDDAYTRLMEAVRAQTGYDTLADANDGVGHHKVLGFFDTAIAACE